MHVCVYRTSGLMTAHVVFMEMKQTKRVSNHSDSDCSRIIVASSLYPLSHLLAGQLRKRSETPGGGNHFQVLWHNCEKRSPVRPNARNNAILTDGFSRNLVLEYFSKFCGENSSLSNI